MDLIKKKFEKKKKKARGEKKKASKGGTKASTKKARKKAAAAKANKRRTASRHSSSSSESSEDSDDSARVRLRAVASKLAVDAAMIDKKYRMAGGLVKKPDNPADFHRRLFEAEWREMKMDQRLAVDAVQAFDNYLKSRAELKSTDHVVIAEKVDDDDKKSTVRLKILTKFDEGRFAAVYMVQNEAAVNNDVISVGNGRLMMKTALRQLSSNQIYLRLAREILTLKSLWSNRNEPPPRVPPLIHEGRMLGLPFYVTNIYDVNLEKCREEMGGGCFSIQSSFHVALELLAALKFLHRRQIVHRDVKPTNVVLSFQNRDQWYLIDYGDAIGAGRVTPALSPPDGNTLPFLSREAHDQLVTPAPTTFQQDLESWFFLIVDMCKPLPWRDNLKINVVAAEKQQFFKNLNKSLTDYPKQFMDIGKLLKTDAQPYREITKRIGEWSRETGWVPEWYDRAATKAARALESKRRKYPSPNQQQQQARGRKPTMVERETTTTTTTTTNEEEEKGTTTMASTPTGGAEKRDRSVYLPLAAESPMNNGRKPTRKVSREAADANKTASYVDDDPPPPPLKQDRSVYFTEFPMAAPINDTKKKYRYKGKK